MRLMMFLSAVVIIAFGTITPALAGGVVVLPPSTASVAIDGNTIHAMGSEIHVYTNGGNLAQVMATEINSGISGLVLAPNHRYLAVIGKRKLAPDMVVGSFQIIDLTTGRQAAFPIGSCDDHQRNPIVFSPDNATLAVLNGGYVRLYYVVTGKPIDDVATDQRYMDVVNITFSSDGDRLILSGAKETRVYYDVRYKVITPTPARKPKGYKGRARG